MKYADVIIDITHERLDQVYQYRIPESFLAEIGPGVCVEVPFGKGNRPTRGYVIAVRDHAEIADDRIKEISKIPERGITIEEKLIRLAEWIRRTYGSTMIQALRTVLPVREKEKQKLQKRLVLKSTPEEAASWQTIFEQKHHAAKARLLEQMIRTPVMDQGDAMRHLGIGRPTIDALIRDGILEIRTEEAGAERKVPGTDGLQADTDRKPAVLTGPQKAAVQKILNSWEQTPEKPVLLEGVTGSGKTLVYMALAETMLQTGKQVIVLIPEIALSWQNVGRFRQRFGDIVAVLHSRMGKRERFEQFERARSGAAKIMIGPRSALFTPFSNTGLIVVDEEQEQSYRSEETPRYDARETAIARANLEGAHVVLGSATPSVDSYARCRDGQYNLVTLSERYGTAVLPSVEIVDMREEMKQGNRSMLSRSLQEAVRTRLARGEQTMLFLNKRGLAGFISCRSCGNVLKCPHCDVSLTAHKNGMLICHYCNYKTRQVTACPVCGSPHIYGFRAGTQKAEQAVHVLYPEARVLRMDADTTRGKEGHDRILRAFAAHEADILIGTQMIVKGHDFPDVTLVGVLLADLSLYASDYRAAERTYQLMVQAVGRAGRGKKPGTAVIQTYAPEHYSLRTAAEQDYRTFFEEEIEARRVLHYPPAGSLLSIHLSCRSEETLTVAAGYIRLFLERVRRDDTVRIIGPAPEAIAKVQEYYRQVITLKADQETELIRMRRQLEAYIEINEGFRDVRIQYDLNR